MRCLLIIYLKGQKDQSARLFIKFDLQQHDNHVYFLDFYFFPYSDFIVFNGLQSISLRDRIYTVVFNEAQFTKPEAIIY